MSGKYVLSISKDVEDTAIHMLDRAAFVRLSQHELAMLKVKEPVGEETMTPYLVRLMRADNGGVTVSKCDDNILGSVRHPGPRPRKSTAFRCCHLHRGDAENNVCDSDRCGVELGRGENGTGPIKGENEGENGTGPIK